MEWISVEDRLPETSALLLVRVSDCNLPAMAIFMGGKNKYWKVQPLFGDWYATNDKVTHWMPLLEPPTAKGWTTSMKNEKSQTIIHVTIDVSDYRLSLDEFEDRVYRLFERAMTGIRREWGDDG